MKANVTVLMEAEWSNSTDLMKYVANGCRINPFMKSLGDVRSS